MKSKGQCDATAKRMPRAGIEPATARMRSLERNFSRALSQLSYLGIEKEKTGGIYSSFSIRRLLLGFFCIQDKVIGPSQGLEGHVQWLSAQRS